MKICLSCDGVTETQAQCCGHCGAWLVPTDTVHYPVRTGEYLDLEGVEILEEAKNESSAKTN